MVPWLVPMKVLPAGPGPAVAPGIDAVSGAAAPEEAEALAATEAATEVSPPDAVAGADAAAPGAEAVFLAAVDADFRTELARLLDDDPFTARLLATPEER